MMYKLYYDKVNFIQVCISYNEVTTTGPGLLLLILFGTFGLDCMTLEFA